MIRILHLSDLHFTPNLSNTDNCLSIDQMIGVENKLKELKAADNTYKFNKVIISGDITNDGSIDSFVRARSWICSQLEVNAGRRTGLDFCVNQETIKIVPGNHDVDFQIPYKGTATEKWKKLSVNFNSEFQDLQPFTPAKPYHYDWIDTGENQGLFFFYMDSSFLGDSFQEKASGFDDLTKRRLLMNIVEKIHSVFNLGISGQLSKAGTEDKISSISFKNSLKIFVSHHYLKNVQNEDREFLKSSYKKDFLNRICLADYDILLNGHRHRNSFFEDRLEDNFDERGKIRYIYKQLRHMLGFEDLPTQLYNPTNGNKFNRNVSLIVRLIDRLHSALYPDASPKNIIDVLNKAIEDDSIKNIETLIRNFMDITEDDKIFNTWELDSQVKVYLQNLNKEQRDKLNKKSNKIISNILTFLKKKSIVSINGGSTTKITKNLERSFNIYEIESTPHEYKFKTIKYRWNEQLKQFDHDWDRERTFRVNNFLDSVDLIIPD